MSEAAELVFDGVEKRFGAGRSRVAALEGVSFQARAGRVTGLVGPDGAGKTTLMRLAAGLLAPDRGEIRSMGIRTLGEPLEVQSRVGYMPQRFGLYEDLTVAENLDLYADLKGLDPSRRQTRYEELMRMTALAPFRRRLAGRLSGGMKQKLGLACALLRTPPLLLLDEPTAGVDPVSRRELWSIIDHLVRDEGVCLVISTAYLGEAARCDDVILLHRGRVVAQDAPASFARSMRGRCYLVSSRSMGRRKLQSCLAASSRVLDAVIDNEQVRLLTRSDQRLDAAEFSRIAGDIVVEATEPTFEDAFVAVLKQEIAGGRPTLKVRGATKPAGQAAIEVVDVQKRFGDFTAVKNISFRVEHGEVFGLLGANGAGKSTTFRMLCGLLPASAGKLMVAGRDLRRSPAGARRGLGYVAQRFSLYGNLTVRQNLVFFAGAYGLGRERRKQRIEWALDVFELADHADEDSAQLALGYRQRLAMAAALLHEPEILFLDEPTSGIDPLARREFWQRINALAEAGVTVLVTTHFMDEANNCDRLVIMADGEALAEGTPRELKARFASDELAEPTMEDAFIGLVERRERRVEAA